MDLDGLGPAVVTPWKRRRLDRPGSSDKLARDDDAHGKAKPQMMKKLRPPGLPRRLPPGVRKLPPGVRRLKRLGDTTKLTQTGYLDNNKYYWFFYNGTSC